MKPLDGMRLVFFGTGDIALPVFRDLLVAGPRPLALVTQPDKPVGRHQELMAPRIKVEAVAAGVPVLQPEVAGEAAAALAALEPDVIVVMAYGQILRAEILSLPRLAILNLHASLLPRHRGASCIQAAIDAGDRVTGVTAMHMVAKLDAGDVIHAVEVGIGEDETGGSLHDRLAALAPGVLRVALERLAEGTAPRVAQDETQVTYAPKLGREHGCLDWTQPAEVLERRIRAYDPWPGTHAVVVEGGRRRRLKVFPPVEASEVAMAPGEVAVADGRLRVGCGSGSLLCAWVQPEGSRRMDAGEYLRGRKPERMELEGATGSNEY